jgi:hypothetical protein
VGNRCAAVTTGGAPCRQAPLTGRDHCFWHDPDNTNEAQEARRLGGLRRRKERTVAGAYEFDGLASAEQIRRLVEIAVVDTLGLENSVARARTLAYLAQTAAKLLELGDLEFRLQEVESALEPRLHASRR